jgi:IS5 family transposase
MFVQHRRDQKLQQYTGSLERMAELVDFGKVAAAVDAACPRPDRSKGGRPPYPTETMVRVLFLQALYNLSDEDTEHQLLDRRSFQRFCALADELRIPDARTVWLFKQRLAQGGMGARAIFDAVQQQLQAHGYIPRGGQTSGRHHRTRAHPAPDQGREGAGLPGQQARGLEPEEGGSQGHRRPLDEEAQEELPRLQAAHQCGCAVEAHPALEGHARQRG